MNQGERQVVDREPETDRGNAHGSATVDVTEEGDEPQKDAAFAEVVDAGTPAVTPPTTRPWGQRTAYVRDPDGNLVELAQDLGR